MKAQLRVLAHHRDFRRLYTTSTLSMFGSSLTTVALPLTAVLLLDASALQMGLLSAAALLPNLILALPAGVWVGRLPYRPVLVTTDLIRVPALGAIPVLAALDVLAMWHLYAIVLVAGVCSLFEAVAAEAFLPRLVPARALLATNSLRAFSGSTIATSGAAVAGVLVQLLGAPLVIAADAFSFLLTAWGKARITDPGAHPPAQAAVRGSGLAQVQAGFTVVFADPLLRSITIAATTGAFAGQVQSVVLVLYLVDDLQLPAGVVGAVIAVAGLAGMAGALVAVGVVGRFGHGPTFIAGMTCAGLAGLVLAAAGGPAPMVPTVVLAVVVVGQLLWGLGPSLYGVAQQTMRQSLVPPGLLPQALATWRVLVFGVQPVGALVGGALGQQLGLRTALVGGAAVMLMAAATALCSPLRGLRFLTTVDHSLQRES